MPHQFLETLTTPAVERARTRYGSHEVMARATANFHTTADLGPDEKHFIQSVDGFYLGTTGEDGWPYVQYRGGPAGFLRVLSPTRMAWADFRGNRQYLSVGAIDATGKVALFLMDYPHRARLKIIGRARVVDSAEDPSLMDELTVVGYRAKVERAIVVDVVAYDWNCQQHITPRYTEAELRDTLRPVETEMARLRTENAELRARIGSQAPA